MPTFFKKNCNKKPHFIIAHLEGKPDGTMLKLTDVSKLHRLGWHHTIEIDEGIHRLYEWYLKGICINHQQ